MKITQVYDIMLLDINNLAKYEIVENKLDAAIDACIANSDYIDRALNNYKEVFKFNIRHSNSKFKLIVGLDKEMEAVFFVSLVITEESRRPICLVYALYSKPGLMEKMAKAVLPYIDSYVAKHRCNKMLFHTDIKNTKAFTRIGKKYNWKPMRTVFERYIDR